MLNITEYPIIPTTGKDKQLKEYFHVYWETRLEALARELGYTTEDSVTIISNPIGDFTGGHIRMYLGNLVITVLANASVNSSNNVEYSKYNPNEEIICKPIFYTGQEYLVQKIPEFIEKLKVNVPEFIIKDITEENDIDPNYEKIRVKEIIENWQIVEVKVPKGISKEDLYTYLLEDTDCCISNSKTIEFPQVTNESVIGYELDS